MSNQNPIASSNGNRSESHQEPPPPQAKQKRGFAVMEPNRVRELARRGGVAAHRVGTAHEFSSDEARAAGRKGGLAAHLRDHDEPQQA
jgi:general stress protein YciG